MSFFTGGLRLLLGDLWGGGVMKLQYVASSKDGKAKGTVTGDYVAARMSNRTIGIVSIPESGQGLGFGLSDGSYIKFQLKADGVEVIYHVPDKK